MQRVLRAAALVLFALVALFLIWFGVTYATVTDMLWFHAAAVPEAARDDVRTLYLALMNLIGGASSALGLLSLYLILMPLRRGASGAATALLVCNGIVFLVAAVTAEELAAATGAPTSWHIMGVLMAVTLAAHALHAASARWSMRRRKGGMSAMGSSSGAQLQTRIMCEESPDSDLIVIVFTRGQLPAREVARHRRIQVDAAFFGQFHHPPGRQPFTQGCNLEDGVFVYVSAMRRKEALYGPALVE